MQTLKIEIPNGYEIDSFDKSSGEIKFKPKALAPKERIKTIADILNDNKWKQQDLDKVTEDLDKDEIAYILLKMLAKSLNDGWVPDWSNSNEYKYVPWFEMKGSSGFRFYVCDYWHALSAVGSRLCFKSSELAEYAGKQFQDLYKQFMIID